MLFQKPQIISKVQGTKHSNSHKCNLGSPFRDHIILSVHYEASAHIPWTCPLLCTLTGHLPIASTCISVPKGFLLLLFSLTKQCLTLLQPHRLWPTSLLCPRDFPGKNTEVGQSFLLQGIFPTQGSNLCLLLGRWTLPLSCLGSPEGFLPLPVTAALLISSRLEVPVNNTLSQEAVNQRLYGIGI